jgi:hypothetical protein
LLVKTFLVGTIVTLILIGAVLPAATSSSTRPADGLITVEASQISLYPLRVIDNAWSPLNSGAGAGAGYIGQSGETVVIDFGKRLAETEREPKWQIKFGRNQSVRVGSETDPVFWIYNDSGDRIVVNVSEAKGLPRGVTLELYADGILVSSIVGNGTPEAPKVNDSIVPGSYWLPANGSAPVYVLIRTDGSVNTGIWEANLRLGFTIPSYEGGDDAAPRQTTTVEIIGLSSTTSLKVDDDGIAQETVQLTSPDGIATITVAKETKLLNAQGKPLDILSATRVTSPPPAPPGTAIASAYSFGPEGAAFSPPIVLTLSYDPLELPKGVEENDLYIAYWNGYQWLKLESTVDTIMKTVSAVVSHFSQFALLYNLPLPSFHAAFQFSELWISSGQTEPGQEVTITVQVTNIGNTEGSSTIELKINGEIEETKVVSIAAGTSKLVNFSVTRDTPGTYQVNLGGLSGEFVVASPVLPSALPATVLPMPPEDPQPTPSEPVAMPLPSWAPIGSTVGAVLVVFLLVYLLWRRMRAVSYVTRPALRSTFQHRAHRIRR